MARSTLNPLPRGNQLKSHKSAIVSDNDEILVADHRDGLTPANMVDQKLFALLGNDYPGMSNNIRGRLSDIRQRVAKGDS